MSIRSVALTHYKDSLDGHIAYYVIGISHRSDQNYEDIKHKVESWFDIVRNMAKVEGIPDIKTEILLLNQL